MAGRREVALSGPSVPYANADLSILLDRFALRGLSARAPDERHWAMRGLEALGGGLRWDCGGRPSTTVAGGGGAWGANASRSAGGVRATQRRY
jgi:hypothetical protein